MKKDLNRKRVAEIILTMGILAAVQTSAVVGLFGMKKNQSLTIDKVIQYIIAGR